MNSGFIIDNSVVMAWCFKDEVSLYADAVLGKLEFVKGYVPSIWPLEVGNVLLVAERKNRISEAGTARFIELLDQLPIVVEQESPDRMFKEVFALAREYRLSSYDASYLDLAMRKGLPIATLDKDLVKAAEKCKVPMFTVE
ncbi:MAG: type II toxin-antitoxin system VapC family toxin [Spirochaetia bacterium]|jgi:predicted nucleic acid-binding protein|nr:type II toxin-antitoxin system VapC family toxin [Spirochaetia bacterium]